jgi:transcriptional regulator with XRE-family HTH domain
VIAGKKTPRVDVAIALADALGVSLDWLAGREAQEPGQLTPLEDQFLRTFRQFTPEEQALALDLIQTLAKSLSKG